MFGSACCWNENININIKPERQHALHKTPQIQNSAWKNAGNTICEMAWMSVLRDTDEIGLFTSF